jgi:DHA2 family multidrug resistance protein
MQAFDATTVNVALPEIARTFGTGTATTSWIVTAYLVSAAITMPITGWLRARFGGERIYFAVVAGYATASLACGLAPSIAMLVSVRTVQGGCAGIILPLTQALLLDLSPQNRHSTVLARWGSAIVFGPIVGPILGGVLTQHGLWPWIFFINIPISVLALAGLLGATAHLPTAERAAGAKIDVVGIILLILSVTAFQLLLQSGLGTMRTRGWQWIAEAVVSGGAAVMLIRHLDSAEFPVIDPSLFVDRNFTSAVLINLVVGAIFYSTITLVPALVEGPMGRGAALAGALVAPRGIATMAAMLLMGRFTRTIDPRIFVACGLLVTAIALGMLAVATDGAPLSWLVLANLVLGIGAGTLITPLSVLTFLTIHADSRTEAAGLYNLARQLGGAVGIAAVTATIAAGTGGFFSAFALLTILAVLTLPLVALFRIPRRSATDADSAGEDARS